MAAKFNKKNSQNQLKKVNIGEIRKSQLMSTYGIGNVVDFIKDTAIIGSVDDWDKDDDFESRQITNENLQSLTGAEFFLEPKTSLGSGFSKSKDIQGYIFPRKLYCPTCHNIIDYRELKNAKNMHQCPLTKDGKKCKGRLVASRFVIICHNGHIDDFPYSWWVHKGKACKCSKNPRIMMYNVENRSDIESLILECSECHERRSMSGIFNRNAFSGESGCLCSGRHPHLGENYYEKCDDVPVVILRSSSNIYFPKTIDALLIPPWSQKAINYIEKHYSYIPEENAENYITTVLSKKNPNFSDKDLVEAYLTVKNQRETGKGRTIADIYEDEYTVLCKDKVDDDRFSSQVVEIPEKFKDYFESVTAIERLVVTKALVGFTRLSANGKTAPLSKEKKNWYPAVEMNGEGIFIKFRKETINKWINNVGSRYDDLNNSYQESYSRTEKFSVKYVMLHTFAHLFIRQLANECGYNAASMNEKIYSDFQNQNYEMNGILIYLSSPDSDGSLGGLVNVAEDKELFNRVLINMLREARWCSCDPLCSSSKHQGVDSLNYAACHACTLLPETSCEFFNVLLDRISIVGTPENPELGIMGDLTSKL